LAGGEVLPVKLVGFLAVAKPAYWRMVQGWLAYMVAEGPRKYGGRPDRVFTVSRPSRSSAV